MKNSSIFGKFGVPRPVTGSQPCTAGKPIVLPISREFEIQTTDIYMGNLQFGFDPFVISFNMLGLA